MSTATTIIKEPQDLLPALRELKQKVFDPATSQALKKCDQRTKGEFVVERLRLTDTILRLETAQLAEYRKELEEHGQSLNEGLTDLTRSLGELESAAQWAQGLGKVLSLVSKIAPIL